MSLIIFFENGRLGNQLSQYAGFKTLFSKDKILLFGCESLKEILLLIDSNIFILSKATFPRGFIFLFHLFLTQLASWKIIGTIKEARTQDTYEVEKQPGLIFNLYLVKSCFFQHHKIINKLDLNFQIRENLINKAKVWLQSQEPWRDSCSLIFVHIRRGDYIVWPSREYPAVLDFSWYERMMSKLKKKIAHPLFLVVTDDIFYARDLFSQREDVIISNNSLYVDLALMSLCSHGILSASSFAWWGAWFSKNSDAPFNKSLSTDRIYIAPKFWAGHRQETWLPPGFTSDWIEYL